jgi:hypothetical protein
MSTERLRQRVFPEAFKRYAVSKEAALVSGK